MTSVDDYLAIPDAYGRRLGGLRWCAGGEAVEHEADEPGVGLTFVLGAQVALFLEGLSADGSFLHFAHVLHLLDMLGYGQEGDTLRTMEFDPPEEFGWLAYHFERTRRPLRNAGALCAVLCRGVPRVPDPPRLDRVVLRLNGLATSRRALPHDHPREEPPLSPERFKETVRAALRAVPPDDLAHWMRHGRGPAEGAGEAVARVVPKTLGEVLAELEARPRLRGASALVARLSGALSLPPRRLAEAELPLGGYADVTNRGLPEQILPGQFALDPDEFLRRFAERELLYYHREEPREPSARELVLLVDQGVRTWGDVRVVLAAAALALGRQADRRGLTLRLATTGNGGEPVEAPGAGVEALGALLEASDLSPSPAPALARVVGPRSAGAGPRDVVVLTHPRSLAGPDVAASARLAADGTRVFAVAVDGAGDVALAELRGGTPVVIGRCRVEAGDPTRGGPPGPAAGARAAWRGDVEPVGFPFFVGPTQTVDDHLFAFDDAGEWLLLADRHGFLRAWKADGSGSEMLPRLLIHKEVLTRVDGVLGVAGGFVVTGEVGGRLVAAHYDFPARTCTAHDLNLRRPERLEWSYSREFHSAVARAGPMPYLALDLGADRGLAMYPYERSSSERAVEAYRQAMRKTPEILVVPEGEEPPARGRAVFLRPRSGALCAGDGPEGWGEFTPLSDGKPVLKAARIIRARWHGGVLACLVGTFDGRTLLHVFDVTGPWRSLGESTLHRDVRDFALSRDGRRLARRSTSRQLVVHDTGGGGVPTLTVPKGRAHDRLRVDAGVGDGFDFLAVQAGRHGHLASWGNGPLVLRRVGGDVRALLVIMDGRHLRMQTVQGAKTTRLIAYDLKRFTAAAEVAPGVTLAVDRLGQIAVIGRSGVVCMFYAFRDQFAAWTPDGTRLGPVPVTGGPPTPDAASKIASVLRAALAEGKGHVP